MAELLNYKIELRAGPIGPAMWPFYEVWFTDDNQDKWRVSKPVNFERALELLRAMHDAYTHLDAIMLPEEFHIVGRFEAK